MMGLPERGACSVRTARTAETTRLRVNTRSGYTRSRDQPGGAARVAADHEDATANVRVVPDKVEIRLIEAHDTIPAASKAARIQLNGIAEHAQCRAESCRQNHVVERLRNPVHEYH